MKKLIFIGIGLLASFNVLSQDFVSNALLFSRTQPSGSARMIGLGGNHAALGGDYSAALINPAGLGLYNRNEVTLTPALNFLNSKSTYFDTASPEESKTAFSIPGLSLVVNTPSKKDRGFMGGSFALTMTRTNDLHLDFRYRGNNSQNSMIDYFIEDADRVDPDILIDEYSLTGLAYNNYLIEDNYDENNNLLGYGTVLNFNSVRQEETSERKGSQTQWSIGYGANFNDKLFVGASIGIASIRYKLSQVFTEDNYSYNPDAPQALDQFTVTEQYDISGSGVNFTLGAIFRPVDFIQIGGSFVTPTYYGITDKYQARISSEWNNFEYSESEVLGSIYQEFPEEQLYEYNIATPLRANLGLALLSEYGFISLNTEFVNYGKAKYSSDVAGEFSGENADIRTGYNSVMNHSIGIEGRKDIFRARIGANYQSDPFDEEDELDRSVKTLSGGVGVRLKNFFADLAVNHSWTEARRIPYFTFVGASDPLAVIKYKSTKYLLTVGFTF